MSNLAILTPKGIEGEADTTEAIALYHARHIAHRIYKTQVKAAPLDAMIGRSDHMIASAEIKCRDYGYDKLMGHYRGEWLLSEDKIEAGEIAHRVFRVGMKGLLYLVPERVLLVVQLVTSGGTRANMQIRRTATPATVNGGTAIRNNAYIDMTGAEVLRWQAGDA